MQCSIIRKIWLARKRECMRISFGLWLQKQKMTVKYAHFSVGKFSWCPYGAGHCIIVLLINNINSSAVIKHISTIINTISSQCRHSLISSRFSRRDLHLLFSCPCHWISHFSLPVKEIYRRGTQYFAHLYSKYLCDAYVYLWKHC